MSHYIAESLSIVSCMVCSMHCGVTYSLADWKQKFLMHWYVICCISFITAC